MGRNSRSFLDHWHDRTMELADGRVLRWGVIASPGREPWVAWFRVDGAGLHAAEGRRLLAEHGHADAVLPIRDDVPTLRTPRP